MRTGALTDVRTATCVHMRAMHERAAASFGFWAPTAPSEVLGAHGTIRGELSVEAVERGTPGTSRGHPRYAVTNMLYLIFHK